MAPNAKSQKALFDDSEDESDGGAQLKVNDEYAQRFEYNKKREERHRLEEKYKGQANGRAGEDDDDDDSSDDETEDEDGYLATEELDAELNATLEAIRNKDPRIYDGKTSFYTPAEAAAAAAAAAAAQHQTKKEKPVYLQDYHRERILAGDIGSDDDEDKPRTYAQEQGDLQKSIVDEIQAQIKNEGAAGEKDDDGDDNFIKPKKGEAARVKAELHDGMHPSRAANVKKSKSRPAVKLDVANADKDPQLYLSNFLAARAWVEPTQNKWQAFESDDEEEPDKADEWEVAYNLRFEDPSKSNEVLKSYARDVAAAKSVRRDEKTARQKKRDAERESKEAEKQERREERARLRKLKIEEAETRLKQIKKAAGLSGKDLKDEDWVRFLDDAWDDNKWEEEMNKRFGEQYYAEGEGPSDDDDDEAGGKKRKIKKPKWDDDIDIKDLIPDFEDEEQPKVTLSDVEEGTEEGGEEEEDDDEDGPSRKRQKTSKDRKKERLASQKEARQERSKIEALVDAKMDLDDPDVLAGSSKAKDQSKFAYRETWPASYGLTATDILMAPSDAALNEFVGLKKLAHFRPDDKRAKDKKRLGKKARLRQWRKDNFGAEAEREGPAFAFGGDAPTGGKDQAEAENDVIEGKSKKRKKRSGRGKNKEDA
ncbi:hypothetical protein JX265_002361 [Neoarthrinium moseri]|uniref:Kri1-like C-terminal domain-containing protein n=1 Tax=Neoarthrinium moseri TaxID=1658444 RepID=A0A9P9WUS5_9PEZI|nr:hypothetical protein JX265_002361 [Neoarthrinium moseri]